MQKRSSGRFGKYGELKRKEKIRQTRLVRREVDPKPSAQWLAVGGRKKSPTRTVKAEEKSMTGETPRKNHESKTEDNER
jgi:hypothetical protein